MTGRRSGHFAPVITVDETAIAAIVALVARTYSRGGNQIEAAARLAARLGWDAARATIEPTQ